MSSTLPSSSPPGSVLVAHPALQHSHQLAQALHARGWLQAFWSGVPVRSADESPPWWLPEQLRQRVRPVDIPRALRLHPLRFPLLLRAGVAGLPPAVRGPASDWIHRTFYWFDAWTAKRLAHLHPRPRVVIAYENSAYLTFTAAKAIGARCVLDAASLHHAAGRLLMPGPMSDFEAAIDRRKEAENALADRVLTCSPLAGESYVQHGVPAERVRPLLLGAELPEAAIAAASAARASAAPGAVPRFLYAGALSRRKSIDLILEAFGRLAQEGFRYELQLVGGLADPSLREALHATPHVTHRDSVPQHELFPLMAQADCLLLPSRFDSFGMVVAEAMACGTPALVSTQTGAKAIIEAVPDSGWIVEPSVESIHAGVRALLENPQRLAQAREAARRAGQQFTWQAYRERAAAALEDLVH